MDDNLLEIRQFVGEGYQPVIDFGAWRVAVLNYIDEIHPAHIGKMERHNETDEVFVLSQGRGILFIGEGADGIEKVQSQVLEMGKIYNVRKAVWHTVVLSHDGSVLIVENRDTREENSNYVTLSEEQRQQIMQTADREQPGEWRE